MIIEIAQECQNSLRQNRPIVALESTIITHGLPYPQNRDLACELEAIIRDAGVVPATIAIVDGTLKVGLSSEEISRLAQADAMKCSLRDLPYAIAEKKMAGTTVAATLFCAHQANINVFATGGIGGVHRSHDRTQHDVSADLEALSRFPVMTVSAGAKAILDLPATLETLERLNVPVIGYQTDFFPAFYSRSSGLQLNQRADNATAIIAIYKASRSLALPAAILIANPIPKNDEIPAGEIARVIEEAITEAQKQNICGGRLTPFLLQYLAEHTAMRSVAANLSLVRNNVHVAIALAKEWSLQHEKNHREL